MQKNTLSDEQIQKQIGKFDPEFSFRELAGKSAIIVGIIAVSLSLFHIYTAGFGVLLAMKHRAVHLTLVMTLIFLLFPARKKGKGRKIGNIPIDILSFSVLYAIMGIYIFFKYDEPIYHWMAAESFIFALVTFIPALRKDDLRKTIDWLDVLMAMAGAFIGIYILFTYDQYVYRIGIPLDRDLIVGYFAILIVMEAGRRAIGPDLPLLGFAFLVYCHFGPSMPGFLAHRGYDVGRIVEHMYMKMEGIFGVPLGVVATFVFHFVLFGTIIAKTGLGQFFIDIAMALAGHTAGGPAKVAVLASGFMGSINGSSIANTVTTGSFTIPMMKRIGYSPPFAAAVESSASTGGQIMPPIMGAAAFIMSEFIGVPYIQIALAAVIPALLYYLGVGVMVHLEAKKQNMKGIEGGRIPEAIRILKERWHLLLPIIFIVFLLIQGYTPFKAAFWGILSSIAIAGMILPTALLTIYAVIHAIIGDYFNVLNPEWSICLISLIVGYFKPKVRLSYAELWEALVLGAKAALAIGAACAAIGFIVGTAGLTGFGMTFANMAVTLAKQLTEIVTHLPFMTISSFQLELFFTLFLTMVACTILGSGLPTTATYIVLATIAAPALLQFNIPLLASHMFVLYFGVIADLTPPVGMAAYAGAGIAGSNPFRTGFTATKLALAGFVGPFLFVYSPELLLSLSSFASLQTFLNTMYIAVTAMLGIVALGGAAEGYFFKKATVIERVILGVASIMLVKPGWQTDAIGGGLFLLICMFQIIQKRTLRRNMAL
ncbi:MAG: TRAP transporter permease [Thermodesulfobacteriota bacterium]|nr:TRAP transporter permease [Thermodesulfobacteriota bacterium]